MFCQIKPHINISTAEAYKGCKPRLWKVQLSESIKEPVIKWQKLIKNDFETQVFAHHKELALIKEKLYANGADFALMSGSGSSIYGISKSNEINYSFTEYKSYILDL